LVFQQKTNENERVIPIKVIRESSKPKRTATMPKQTSSRTSTKSQDFAKRSDPASPVSNASSEDQLQTEIVHDDVHRMTTSSPPTSEDCKENEAIQKISSIMQDIDQIEQSVNVFFGNRRDKVYLKLEDSLTKKLLRLDEIEVSGSPREDELRAERRGAVRKVQQLIDVLDAKASSVNLNVTVENAMKHDDPAPTTSVGYEEVDSCEMEVTSDTSSSLVPDACETDGNRSSMEMHSTPTKPADVEGLHISTDTSTTEMLDASVLHSISNVPEAPEGDPTVEVDNSNISPSANIVPDLTVSPFTSEEGDLCTSPSETDMTDANIASQCTNTQNTFADSSLTDSSANESAEQSSTDLSDPADTLSKVDSPSVCEPAPAMDCSVEDKSEISVIFDTSDVSSPSLTMDGNQSPSQ